jgi:hypothetical protein
MKEVGPSASTGVTHRCNLLIEQVIFLLDFVLYAISIQAILLTVEAPSFQMHSAGTGGSRRA